jgi:uncharacterized protein (TIGR00369 family)
VEHVDTRSPEGGAGKSDAQASDARMSLSEVDAFLDREFDGLRKTAPNLSVEAVWYRGARLRLAHDEAQLRPGGTISGPAMFTLADVCLYVAVLGAIGPVALAVTTNMTINFLRRPRPGDLIAEAHILKLGKTLAIGEIGLRSSGEDELCAHAVGTYSLPSDAAR